MTNRHAVTIVLIIVVLLSSLYFIKALLHKTPMEGIAEKGRQLAEKGVEDRVVHKRMKYDNAVNKNIFHPDRKYRATPGDNGTFGEGMVPSEMPALSVKGIVVKPDGEFVAYIAQGKRKARPVHIGDSIDNFKVVSITRSDVTIKWNDQDIKLSLKKVRTIHEKR